MRKTELILAIAAVSLLLAAGCRNRSESASYVPAPSGSATAAQQTSSVTPEQLGEIGAQIKRHPREAKSILSDHGMTEQSFERAIRRVSSDPAASKRYAAAYKRAI
jgi:hypothetical protein